MTLSLALIAGSALNGPVEDDGPKLAELAPPDMDDPASEEEDPTGDPDPGAEEEEDPPEVDPFDPAESGEAWDGAIELVAVVDLRRIDGETRAALELPSSGVVYVYTPSDGDIDNTFVRLDGHPAMRWDAVSFVGTSFDPSPHHAIVTSEFWSDEVLRSLEVIHEGAPMPSSSVVIDERYASDDLRDASSHPYAPYFVVTVAEEGLQGPYEVSPFGPMAVSVPVSADPWSDFVDYVQAPADYGSSVGHAWAPDDMDASDAWRAGVDLGEAWEYEVTWLQNSPM
ncbi:MAG TPA: hypothetical protein QGF58_25005 [Myxococcota bacterium]|nr:hypothetical protein [Myxococcota bacterium]